MDTHHGEIMVDDGTLREAPKVKKKSAWSSLRVGVKRRISMGKWLTTANEGDDSPENKWPNDEKDSQFGNALVALMQRTGSYPDLDKKASKGPERKKRKTQL